MTKSVCQVCGATFGGIPLNTVQNGKKVEACPACYRKLDAEYRKNSCLTCVFFNVGTCELFATDLEEPYVNSVTCEFFTTDPDPAAVAKARIKKFEMNRRFDKAAVEYEKLGLTEKAKEAREKAQNTPAPSCDVNELVAQLTQKGQTLTYYCCHCGESLKVGANQEVLKICPHCKCDLGVIDLGKLISQHI
jgi:hypothetical protein